jgi:D-beta-D-heptose 7-phosphate kinase/D-beta-D-heptose 1-phosphate adenosyltransferase
VSRELLDVLERGRGKSVLVIGDVMLDRYWWGSVERTSPEAPVPVVRKTRASIAAGGAANVATNIAGLGGVASLVGLVGDDEAGRELREALAAHPRVTPHLVRAHGRPTTVKTRVIAHSQHVVRVDEESAQPASDEEALALIDAVKPFVERADAVVCSDYAKGVLSPRVLSEVIALARARKRPVLVDPKGVDYRRYAGATLLSPNLGEAAAAAAISRDEVDAAGHAAEILLKHIEVGAVLVTQGEAGMTLLERGRERVHIPARPRRVFDVTGAGDTAMAALALAVAAGADLATAARLANVAAGLAVEQVATTVVKAEDVERVERE